MNDDNPKNNQTDFVHSSESKKTWVGRFAPSPSGPLHLGSLAAAVASFMIAKQNKGKWLLRIEDIDLPRVVKGASSSILQSLEDFGLFWDGEVIYQSQRSDLYQQKLLELEQKLQIYCCDCSRKQSDLRQAGSYDGFCRSRKLTSNNAATRIKFADGFESFSDKLLGECRFTSAVDKQDFVLQRRDKIFAYQLAVVVDDIEQGVDHIVRGEDILDSTPRQNFLYHCFNHQPPSYYHLPLVKNKQGIKFSKRAHSSAIDKHCATILLLQVFEHLGQKVDKALEFATVSEIIDYYLDHWQTSLITNKSILIKG